MNLPLDWYEARPKCKDQNHEQGQNDETKTKTAISKITRPKKSETGAVCLC